MSGKTLKLSRGQWGGRNRYTAILSIDPPIISAHILPLLYVYDPVL